MAINCRFDHVHLVCSDVGAATRFLVEKMGAVERSRTVQRSTEIIRMELGGQLVCLRSLWPDERRQGGEAGARFGLDHWALQVDDVDAAYEQLAAKGVEFAVKPTLSDTGSSKYAFLLGPDNIQIELLQRL